MRSIRWSGPVLAALVTVFQINVTASAQVSGEILVGRTATPLATVAPATETPAASPYSRGNVAEPRPVQLPQPVYPRAARAARQDGRVTVCFTVDERGRVRTPAVSTSTDAVFNQPVLDAISAAQFTPAQVGKQAVRSTACRTFRFELR
jgi:TonB family protein